VQDQPWAKDITAELAYRFSDYSNAGVTHTYKIAGDWTVIDGLRFRGGYNRAVRAPNVVELFSPQNVVLDGTTDPCAEDKSPAMIARCSTLFGLTPTQVQNLEPDPANQYNGQTGGNPNLKPEKADTYTVGVVWSPTFAPGLNFTLDYFDIKVKDYISNIGADTIINACINGTKPDFCALVHRDSNGTIRTQNGFVTDTTFNTGALHTSGIDVSATYRTGLDTFGLNNAGSVSLSFVGTWLDKLETTPAEGRQADRLRRPLRCGLLGARRLAEPEPGMAPQDARHLEHAVRIRLAGRRRPVGAVALLLVGEAGRHLQQPGAERQHAVRFGRQVQGAELHRPAGDLEDQGPVQLPGRRQQRVRQRSAAERFVELPDRPLQPERLAAGL
jgi:hypothetical protein